MSLPRAGLRVVLIVMDQGLKLCTRDLEMPEKDGVLLDERDAARGQLRDRGKPLLRIFHLQYFHSCIAIQGVSGLSAATCQYLQQGLYG